MFSDLDGFTYYSIKRSVSSTSELLVICHADFQKCVTNSKSNKSISQSLLLGIPFKMEWHSKK